MTLTEVALLIFFNPGWKNWCHGREFEPTTLDLSSQSGAYDLSDKATPDVVNIHLLIF